MSTMEPPSNEDLTKMRTLMAPKIADAYTKLASEMVAAY
jgi:hypothetical protein